MQKHAEWILLFCDGSVEPGHCPNSIGRVVKMFTEITLSIDANADVSLLVELTLLCDLAEILLITTFPENRL